MVRNILVFGADGYLGWPLTMALARSWPDSSIIAADNFARRAWVGSSGASSLTDVKTLRERVNIFSETFGCGNVSVIEQDVTSPKGVRSLFEQHRPELIYHLAHQPSAPFSLADPESANKTVQVNEQGCLNILWGLKDTCPDSHLILMGTFGGYARAGLPVPEGYFTPSCEGLTATKPVPFPRESDDIYHVSKINASNFAAMASRIWSLTVTDVQQSTVFGSLTDETIAAPGLATRFDYDPVFGTVLNRFTAQAISGQPLTIYGDGAQVSGISVLPDVIKALISMGQHPPEGGSLRVVNNIASQLTVNQLASLVAEAGAAHGLEVRTERGVANPRNERQTHFAGTARTGFLGQWLTPTPILQAITQTMEYLLPLRGRILTKFIRFPEAILGP